MLSNSKNHNNRNDVTHTVVTKIKSNVVSDVSSKSKEISLGNENKIMESTF